MEWQMAKRRIAVTRVSNAQNSKITSSLFQQQITKEEIFVQGMKKLTKWEPVYLAVVRTIEDQNKLANEEVATMNEDKTKTLYQMQVQALLNEFSDVFPKDLPARLPPQCQLDPKIELVPGAEPPHSAPYHMSP